MVTSLLTIVVLTQIAKVERYEAKLSVMAFIGVFDELMRTVMPVGFVWVLFVIIMVI